MKISVIFLVLSVLGSVDAAPQPHFQRKLHWNFPLEVNEVAFSPNGALLYLATSKGLFLRETRTGKPRPTFLLPPSWSNLTHVQVSSGGRYLAVVAQKEEYSKDTRLFVWDLKTRRLKMASPTTDAQTLVFSPHEHWLAVSDWSDDTPTVKLIETRTWKNVRYLDCQGLMPPYMLDFSRDGKLLAGTAYYGDAAIGDLTLWNANTGKKIWYADEMSQGPLYFLPRSKRMVLGMEVVAVDSKTKNGTYKSPTDSRIFPTSTEVTRWLAAPYGRHSNLFLVKKAIQAGANPVEGLELWDVARKKRIVQWKVRFNGYQEYTTSPDGHWLVVGSTNIYEIVR